MKSLYTPLKTNIAMENPPFCWYLPEKMVIFHGYVSLPEGTSILDDLARHGDDFRMIKINLLNHHTGAGPCFFQDQSGMSIQNTQAPFEIFCPAWRVKKIRQHQS